MRAFIETNLNHQAKEKILAKITELSKLDLGKIKWQKENQFHLTLCFLDEINQNQTLRAADTLTMIATRFQPFEIEFKGLGVFPLRGEPRIIWLGVGEGSDQLIRLQNQLVANLNQKGFSLEERQYIPHLTLARVKRSSSQQIQDLVRQNKSLAIASQKIKELKLVKSQLLPKGVRYATIKSVKL